MSKDREIESPAPLDDETRATYKGYTQGGWRSRPVNDQSLTKIEQAMQDAVKHEEFELAAGLRDAFREATEHYESLPAKLIKVRD